MTTMQDTNLTSNSTERIRDKMRLLKSTDVFHQTEPQNPDTLSSDDIASILQQIEETFPQIKKAATSQIKHAHMSDNKPKEVHLKKGRPSRYPNGSKIIRIPCEISSQLEYILSIMCPKGEFNYTVFEKYTSALSEAFPETKKM